MEFQDRLFPVNDFDVLSDDLTEDENQELWEIIARLDAEATGGRIDNLDGWRVPRRQRLIKDVEISPRWQDALGC